jgi:tetratricopeptide (TPR) repeat protein
MEDFNEQAAELISKRALDEAATLLEQALRTMPHGWKPIQDLPDEQLVACWDTQEFLCYTAHMQGSGSQRKIFWVPPSYSRGYYLLAMIYMECGQVQEALEALDQGLQLEPDHPQLMNEKAYIFQKTNRPADAFLLFQRAATARPNWTPNYIRARTLRGLGVTLVDFGRFEDAEALLKSSLEIEPNNPLALSELDYIAKLRASRPPV